MSTYPDEFDQLHKDLVADAATRPEYTEATPRDRTSALYGYSEGAEHALDSVRLRLNRIKAQALREVADELAQLPYARPDAPERAEYEHLLAVRRGHTDAWLRGRAEQLERS